MSLAAAIDEARAKLPGGKLEEGETFVFQCPDGLLILSNEDDRLTSTVVFEGTVIPLTSRLDDEEPASQ